MDTLHMLARDVMTTEPATVPPTMPIEALARLLGNRNISSAPVVDAQGQLLGLVTEADILRRVAAAEDRPLGWLRQVFSDSARQADIYARTHGRTAGDVMTKNLITVDADTTVAHCAHLMEKHHIKRLPVVEQGRLLGIVSRADLLCAAMEPPQSIGTEREDHDRRIRRALEREIQAQPWAYSLYTFAEVSDGVVTLHGFCRSEEARRALCVLAQQIEGVTRVEDRMEQAPTILVGEVI